MSRVFFACLDDDIVGWSSHGRRRYVGAVDIKESQMPSDPSAIGTETERLHFCTEHAKPCEKCSACNTYSYCPACDKCYEPNCAKG